MEPLLQSSPIGPQAKLNKIKDVFREWDRHNTGSIQDDHLKRILKQLDPDFPDMAIDTLLETFDRTPTNGVDYESFIDFIFSGVNGTAIFMWSFDTLVKTYRISTRNPVRQLLVGSYSAFMLLEDGNVFRIGPTSCEDDSPLASPQPLTELVVACGEQISALGMDYTTLFAIAGNCVWMQDRPGEATSGGLGAASILLGEDLEDPEAEETDTEDVEQRLRAQVRGSPTASKSLRDLWKNEGPRRARSLCDCGVVAVRGDQVWGVATTSAGAAVFYCGVHARSRDVLGSHIEVPFEAGAVGLWKDGPNLPAGLVVDIDVGEMQVIKSVMPGCAKGALFVLSDGSVAALGNFAQGATACLAASRLRLPTIRGLQGIVDVTADGSVFLDTGGGLWKMPLSAGLMVDRVDATAVVCRDVVKMPVVECPVVHRLCGEVAVAKGQDGDDAYAIGRRCAGIWMSSQQRVWHVESGGCFGMCHLTGEFPDIGLCSAAERADRWLDGAANLLAHCCGKPLMVEDNFNLSRLEGLLINGCNAAAEHEGIPLLLRFAERAADGELGMIDATRMLARYGACQERALNMAIANDDEATVHILRGLVCAT